MAGVLKKSYISRGVTWQKICEQDWSDYFIVEVNLFGKKSLNWGKKWTCIWCLEGSLEIRVCTWWNCPVIFIFINIKISQFHGKLVLFMPKICVYFFLQSQLQFDMFSRNICYCIIPPFLIQIDFMKLCILNWHIYPLKKK